LRIDNFFIMIRHCLLKILFGIFYLSIGCNGSSDTIEKNIQNAKKLKLGMALDDALKIMGEPHIIKEHANYKGIFDYYYESPFGASDWIYFSIDSTQKVTQITTF
jgi:hypothetical protein